MSDIKTKMSASYLAIFVLSIVMLFVFLILGALSQSQGGGGGGIQFLIWGRTAWLMHKRRNEDLVLEYKCLLWFYAVMAAILLIGLTFSNQDISHIVGMTIHEIMILFGAFFLVSYALLYYFKAQISSSNELTNKLNGLVKSDDHWEQAFKEVNGGERVATIWTRAFSEADGDENKSKALYLKYRINQLESKVGEKVTDKVSPVISINHVELKETAQKTVYQMFNDENNIYISDQKQSKKSDRGTWMFFIFLIFLILFLIKDHRLL